MSESHTKTKEWYKHGWGLVVAVLFFPYFLIWYAWAKSNWSKGIKIGVTAVVSVVMLPIIIGAATAEPDTKQARESSAEQNQVESVQEEEIKEEKTFKEKLSDGILSLVGSKKAFDSGSYVKGDIPQGEYAFVSFDGSGKYYSEEDAAGNIIDNENFDSFGYVYVHGAGNLTNDGLLISTASLKSLGVKGAKDAYEKLNETSDYKGSAMYKVGVDINPGQYIIQSLGSGYAETHTGPVGNSEIIDNENFNGRHSVSVQRGQYLSISGGQITN